MKPEEGRWLRKDASTSAASGWRPVDDAGIDVVSPHTEEVIARAPAAGPADVDRAVAAARAADRRGPVAPPRPGRAHRRRPPARRRLRRAPHARWPSSSPPRWARRSRFSKLAQATLPCTMLSAFADVAAGARLGGGAPRLLRRRTSSCARSRSGSSPPSCRGTCRSSSIVGEAGPGAARRVRRRAQAGARDAARRAAAGRDDRRGSACRRASSACCRASARPARTWSVTPGSTRWRSPGSTAAGRQVAAACAANLTAGEPRAGRQVGRRSSSTTPTRPRSPPAPGSPA